MQRNSRDSSRARASLAGSGMISSGCTAKAEFARQTTKPSASTIMRTDFILLPCTRGGHKIRGYLYPGFRESAAGQQYRVMRYGDDGADRIRTNGNAPVAEAFARCP